MIKIPASLLAVFVLTSLVACKDKTSEAEVPAPVKNNSLLTNGGFEATSGHPSTIPSWSFSQHAGEVGYEALLTDEVSYAGKQSVRINNIRPQIYGLVAQSVNLAEQGVKEGDQLKFCAQFKSENVGKNAGGLSVNLKSGSAIIKQVKSSPDLVAGTKDWQQVCVTEPYAAGVNIVSFGIILMDSGSLFVDDANFEIIKASE